MKKSFFLLLALAAYTWSGSASLVSEASTASSQKPFYQWEGATASTSSVQKMLSPVWSAQGTTSDYTMTANIYWDEYPPQCLVGDDYPFTMTPTLSLSFYGPVVSFLDVDNVGNFSVGIDFVHAYWPTILQFNIPGSYLSAFGSWNATGVNFTAMGIEATYGIPVDTQFPKVEKRPIYVYGIWAVWVHSPKHASYISHYCLQKQVLVSQDPTDSEFYRLQNENLNIDFYASPYTVFVENPNALY